MQRNQEICYHCNVKMLFEVFAIGTSQMKSESEENSDAADDDITMPSQFSVAH